MLVVSVLWFRGLLFVLAVEPKRDPPVDDPKSDPVLLVAGALFVLVLEVDPKSELVPVAGAVEFVDPKRLGVELAPPNRGLVEVAVEGSNGLVEPANRLFDFCC